MYYSVTDIGTLKGILWMENFPYSFGDHVCI